MTYRIGRKNRLNLYEVTPGDAEDRSVTQCHTPEDAARIVEAVNAQEHHSSVHCLRKTCPDCNGTGRAPEPDDMQAAVRVLDARAEEYRQVGDFASMHRVCDVTRALAGGPVRSPVLDAESPTGEIPEATHPTGDTPEAIARDAFSRSWPAGWHARDEECEISDAARDCVAHDFAARIRALVVGELRQIMALSLEAHEPVPLDAIERRIRALESGGGE